MDRPFSDTLLRIVDHDKPIVDRASLIDGQMDLFWLKMIADGYAAARESYREKHRLEALSEEPEDPNDWTENEEHKKTEDWLVYLGLLPQTRPLPVQEPIPLPPTHEELYYMRPRIRPPPEYIPSSERTLKKRVSNARIALSDSTSASYRQLATGVSVVATRSRQISLRSASASVVDLSVQSLRTVRRRSSSIMSTPSHYIRRRLDSSASSFATTSRASSIDVRSPKKGILRSHTESANMFSSSKLRFEDGVANGSASLKEGPEIAQPTKKRRSTISHVPTPTTSAFPDPPPSNLPPEQDIKRPVKARQRSSSLPSYPTHRHVPDWSHPLPRTIHCPSPVRSHLSTSRPAWFKEELDRLPPFPNKMPLRPPMKKSDRSILSRVNDWILKPFMGLVLVMIVCWLILRIAMKPQLVAAIVGLGYLWELGKMCLKWDEASSESSANAPS